MAELSPQTMAPAIVAHGCAYDAAANYCKYTCQAANCSFDIDNGTTISQWRIDFSFLL